MNNNNNLKIYASHLEQEIKWVDSLNSILAAEKEVLANRQFTQLEEIATQKGELSQKLETSAQQRISLMDHNGNDAENSLLNLLKNSTTEDSILISNLNQSLAEKLHLCRELNAVNGQVIASNIHIRQEIVNALSGNPSSGAGVYNANGDLKENIRYHTSSKSLIMTS